MENQIIEELRAMRQLLQLALSPKNPPEYHQQEIDLSGGLRMATLSTDKAGGRMIQFNDKHGKRRSLRIGKLPIDAAEMIRRHVSNLVAANVSGTTTPKATADWLADVGDQMAERMAAVGLIPARAPATLGAFVGHLLAKYATAKPNTLKNLKHATGLMLNHFGDDRRLVDITPDAADDWVRSLRPRFAPATVARLIKYAKQVFNAADAAKIVSECPLAGIKAGSMANPARQHFVSAEDAGAILKACPNAEWRLIFALSRFGGLTCPSEHMQLRWSDIDWDRGRFHVRKPKIEHHEGGGLRWVPLFPEVRAALEEYRHDGEFVFLRSRSHYMNLRTTFERIICRSGLVPWPKPFQNLRSSRETELLQQFPAHVVAAWLGHTVAIQTKHYAQVTEADWSRALHGCGARAVESAALQTAANQKGAGNSAKKAVPAAGKPPETAHKETLEQAQILQFSQVVQIGGNAAASLQEVAAGWRSLPPSTQAAIAEIVRLACRKAV